MKNYFSISQTAEIVGVTAEALRHYDRIGLVRPAKTDEWTGYRYYSRQEIVRLNTVKALRCMGLPLSEIKEILSYEDFNRIVAALKDAERGAEAKLEELNEAKAKIQRARAFYEDKLKGEKPSGGIFVRRYPQRAVLLSENLEQPTLDNLWNYHRHFYDQIPDEVRGGFAFEDLAGVYESDGRSRLFAVCTRYKKIKGLKILPQGDYLCADCAEDDRVQTLEKLTQAAEKDYGASPEFAVQIIVLSGILQWNYQAQVFIGNGRNST